MLGSERIIRSARRSLNALAVSAALGLTMSVACGGKTSDPATGSSGSGASGGSDGSSGSGVDTGSGGISGGYGGVSGGGASGRTSGGGSGAAGSASGGGSGASAGSFGSAGAFGAGAAAAVLPAEWRACTANSECKVREAQCCELCGPVSADRAVAFNSRFMTQVESRLCEGWDPVMCPVADCAVRPNYFLPFCLENSCTVVDIRETELMSCNTSNDCRLRWDTSCCEQCGAIAEQLTAVNARVDFEAGVCPANFAGCPPCAPPPFPAGARPACSSNRCEVRRTLE